MAGEKKKKDRPLLWDTDLATDTVGDLSAADAARVEEDPNWIPGYSEYVRAESLSRAEYGSMAYQQRAHQLKQLGIEELRGPPIHIKPVRVASIDGTVNDNVLIDLAQYKKDGYRPVTADVLESYGMKMPPLYSVAADGTIRRGDVALMFVDAQRAKQIRDRKFEETRAREDASDTIGGDTGIPIDVEVSRNPDFSF